MKRFGSTVLAGLLGAVLVGTSAASAPVFDPGFLGTQGVPSTGLLNSGLLDLSRFDVSHSLTFATTSSSFGTQSGGLWLTRVGYRVSNPLNLAVDVGAFLDPSGDGPILSEQNVFLKGFNLDYRPSRNFRLSLAYSHLPSRAAAAFGLPYGGLGGSPWGSPLGQNR